MNKKYIYSSISKSFYGRIFYYPRSSEIFAISISLAIDEKFQLVVQEGNTKGCAIFFIDIFNSKSIRLTCIKYKKRNVFFKN